MNVLLVAEKEGTAIHRLCVYTQKSNPQHEFKIVCVHPKRPSPDQLRAFEEAWAWCDVVDYRYWKTAELLINVVGTGKPAMLTHYNPYDLKQKTWSNYKKNIVVNKYQKAVLKTDYLIPLPVDTEFWAMRHEFEPERLNTVCMVSNRIEGKKGILPVAQATHELGMKMILVGRPSDPEYLKKILAYPNVEYLEGIPDEDLREVYYRSGIHVCNSVDDFESGTMPILEAIACGVPVLTRSVGHVPDIWDGTNMQVNTNAPDAVEHLKKHLKFMRENYDLMKSMREKAWGSIKYRNLELYGRKYSKLYHELLSPEQELVSVIVPTCDRPENLKKVLVGLAVSRPTFRSFEVIVVDDSASDSTKIKNIQIVEALKEVSHMTIRYLTSDRYHKNGTKTYGLAAARNRGIVEAEGTWLMFVDDRFTIDPGAIASFYEKRVSKEWQFGIKDGIRKGFVENLSFVERKTLIKIGMFNEQINAYGGMTQDISNRARLGGVPLKLNEDASAKSHAKSGNRNKRYQEIVASKTKCYKLYQE